MNDQQFALAIKEYKDGNPDLLKEFVSSVKKIDPYQWYSLLDLMQEQKKFNMRIGDSYITGSLEIFTEALLKANKKNGSLAIEKRISFNMLAEDPLLFNEFVDVYKKKAMDSNSYTLTSTFLSLNTGFSYKFWESVYGNLIDDFDSEKYSDKEAYNIIKNINKIFDLDKSQHFQIIKTLEMDTYPTGQVMQKIFDYSINEDLSASKNKMLHNEEYLSEYPDRLLEIKRLATIVKKFTLEEELKNNSQENSSKPKNKI